MRSERLIHYAAIVSVLVAIGLAIYLAGESKATSYLGDKPETCINCHVMYNAYATWQHSSHANRATCVDCHLPVSNYVDKYSAKARDGWNHSVAFTLTSYAQHIQISEDGARRVKENCIHCHASFSQTLVRNLDRYHSFSTQNLGDRDCWDCHREVPHGKVRGLSATPYSIAVKKSYINPKE